MSLQWYLTATLLAPFLIELEITRLVADVLLELYLRNRINSIAKDMRRSYVP